MKILLAPDKFKGSLSAQGVCQALSEGILKTNPKAEIISKPLADGGDGSLAVLDHYFDLKTITRKIQDPLGRPIAATYKMAENSAYIEMAVASGLALLMPEERNCMYTTSFGTGELILDAIEKGAKEIFLFIGGSATNDGGIGIANALGYQFYDTSGNRLTPIGENLLLIDKIEDSHLFFNPKEVVVQVICDVNNPFFGQNGAAYVYGAQKGASPSDIAHLDRGLANLAARLEVHGFPNIANIAGAGAAGGIGGGAIAFLGAKLKSGIQTFLEITELETTLKDCDLVITGEGKLDSQTEQGKVISGVCKLAKKYDKPVIAVCGAAEFPIPESLNIQQVYTVLERTKSFKKAMQHTAIELKEIGKKIGQKHQI